MMAKEKQQPSEDAQDQPKGPAPTPRLQTRYTDEVAPKLAEKFGLKNTMSHPKLEKIVLTVNMGRQLENNKLPGALKDAVISTLTTISGQKPIIIKAKKSVSNFKVREGAETAAMVTIRRDRMWFFLDRLINLATPRIKDFRGLPTTSFDGQGNYSFGLTEQGVFPEINMAEVSFTHGMNINLTFSNSTPERSAFLLAQLGMPFKRPEQN